MTSYLDGLLKRGDAPDEAVAVTGGASVAWGALKAAQQAVRELLARARVVLGGFAARRPRLTILAAVLYSLGLLAVGLAAGNALADRDVKKQLSATLGALPGVGDWMRARELKRQVVRWELLPDTTNLHHLEAASIILAPFDSFGGGGGAIEEIEGNIVFASPMGQLGYLSRDGELHALDARAPMNLAALQASEVYRNPRFVMSYFRVLDLLVVETGQGAYDLYASHHRYGDGCFELVVSRLPIAADDAGLHPDGAGWDEIFVAKPCMPTKDIDLLWGGLESGGRMVLRDERTMLLSIGDHQFDGVRWPVAFAQEPTVDLGKIVEIDLTTRASRVFSSGHRNPQGLLVARDGTIWETEHGPQGGDEINVIRDGANYGWPEVTYGMDYGWRPRLDWPLNPVQGRHDGYAHPAFSFVPSVAVGNLIQPDPREFPLWRDHLLVASLGGYRVDGTGTLYIVKVEDGIDPVYAEPLPIRGERLRDLISLEDGRIAVLTDSGRLLLLRNEDRMPDAVSPHEEELVVSLSADAAVAVQTAAAPADPVEHGRRVFAAKCAACHLIEGEGGQGPALAGVVGRRMGSTRFGYSPALAARDEVWTARRLVAYLTDPGEEFAGSTMPPQGLSRADAAAVVDFLDGT